MARGSSTPLSPRSMHRPPRHTHRFVRRRPPRARPNSKVPQKRKNKRSLISKPFYWTRLKNILPLTLDKYMSINYINVAGAIFIFLYECLYFVQTSHQLSDFFYGCSYLGIPIIFLGRNSNSKWVKIIFLYLNRILWF